MSRVWWCSCHPTVKSCWVLVYSALLYYCYAGVVDGWMTTSDDITDGLLWCYRCIRYLFPLFSNSEPLLHVWTMICNELDLIRVVLWTRLRVSFNAYVRSSVWTPSDLPGVNPATNNRMILYYRLMTKVDGLLADSTIFSWAGSLGQKWFVLAAKTGFSRRARHPPATFSQ
jgi:hypothetical protein